MGTAWLNFLAGEMWAELENWKEPGRMRKNAANSNIYEIFEDKDLGNPGKHSKGYEETLEGTHSIKIKKSTIFGEIKDGFSENMNTCFDKMWISCRGILF